MTKQSLLWLALVLSPLCRGELLAVDDSYTPSERFARYSQTHPELRLPVLAFAAGQEVLFERRYRELGKRELHLDVFKAVSKAASNPGIVLIHGGGWRSGNKSHFYPLANLLAQKGYVVILPEYRLSAEAPYPAGLEDINQAIAWAKAHAKELGLDVGRLAIGGASSGGQMASLLAYTAPTALYKGEAGGDYSLAALIDMDGVLDFTDPLALANENKKGAASAAALWLGGDYQQAPERWREASPASHVSAKSPPTLVISSGQPRFSAGYQGVFAALAKAGIKHRFYAFDTIHTFWLFEPYLSQTATQIDLFMQQVVGHSPG